MEEARESPLREPVVVDSNSDRHYLTIVKQALRGLKSRIRPASSLVGKVSFRRSEPDEMLQLADMVCGAVGSWIDGEDTTAYTLIDGRNLGILRLP